jgi:hypothetical protein
MAEHVQHDYAELLTAGRKQSLRILEKAISKASGVECPEALFAQIANAAIAVHTPDDACRLIEKMAAHLKRWEKDGAAWPKSRVNAFASFAECVAPFSFDKRDAYLNRAQARSTRQHSDDEQVTRMLGLERELWSVILLSRKQSSQARATLRALLLEAKKLGYFESDAPRSYVMALLDRLTRLDPVLMLKVWPKENKEHLPAYCMRQARELHEQAYGGTNRFSEILLAYAVKHGKPSVKLLKLYKFYDTEHAYERAAKLPADNLSGGFYRSWATKDILGYWAWSDPEKALELAEQEKDSNVLRDVIQAVSTTWAYVRPEQIERALQKQDNKVRKSWARRIASEELARRREGKPPTTSPDALCPVGESPRPSTRQRFACSRAERDRRIAMLRETIETSEDDALYELTCLFMHDKALAFELMQPNKYYATRQSYLVRVIYKMGYWGDHGLGEELLEEIERPEAYVRSACDLAKNVMKRIYVLHGKDAPRIRKRANTGKGTDKK